MIDELKNDEVIKKAGGKFKLTALVQRRLGELLQGSRPLIDDTKDKTLLEIVVQEILQEKICVAGSPADTSSDEGERKGQL